VLNLSSYTEESHSFGVFFVYQKLKEGIRIYEELDTMFERKVPASKFATYVSEDLNDLVPCV
jgi:hypothetical protein